MRVYKSVTKLFCLITQEAMKTSMGAEVKLHAFLSLLIDEIKRLASCIGRSTFVEDPTLFTE